MVSHDVSLDTNTASSFINHHYANFTHTISTYTISMLSSTNTHYSYTYQHHYNYNSNNNYFYMPYIYVDRWYSTDIFISSKICVESTCGLSSADHSKSFISHWWYLMMYLCIQTHSIIYKSPLCLLHSHYIYLHNLYALFYKYSLFIHLSASLYL